ncbi:MULTISPECIES: hypothetical protein [Burkholderia]|uniref:hypothetical protein n=1 Tax=Burkholderia TaxID=32008 RepID=UPI00163ABB32|nr:MULTISPECIES: hypothetical protein [Burkholderia]
MPDTRSNVVSIHLFRFAQFFNLSSVTFGPDVLSSARDFTPSSMQSLSFGGVETAASFRSGVTHVPHRHRSGTASATASTLIQHYSRAIHISLNS